MSLIKSLLFTLLLAAAAVQASTRDEIERLWNPQGMARAACTTGSRHVSQGQKSQPPPLVPPQQRQAG